MSEVGQPAHLAPSPGSSSLAYVSSEMLITFLVLRKAANDRCEQLRSYRTAGRILGIPSPRPTFLIFDSVLCTWSPHVFIVDVILTVHF